MAKKIAIPPPPPRAQRITATPITAQEPNVSAAGIVSGMEERAPKPPSSASIALARELFRSGNYNVTDAKLNDWASLIDKQGLDSALATWQAKGARGTVTPEFVEAVGGLPEFQQISPEQARGIAEQFAVFGTGNVRSMKDLDDLTNYIQDFGVDAAFARMREQGGDIGTLRGEIVPDDVAKAFVDALYDGSNYQTANKNEWINLTKTKGIQEAFDQWKSKGNKGGNIEPEQLESFKTQASEGLETLVGDRQAAFDRNIQQILAGEDVTPDLGFEITPKRVADQLFKDTNLNISKSDAFYQDVLGMAERFGPETAVAYFNNALAVYGREPGAVRAPLENFVPDTTGTGAATGIYEKNLGTGAAADIYGERSEQPAVNLSAQQPTINLPAQQPQAGLPSALPGPRALVTPTERPTLSPREQIIGALAAQQQPRGPIQAMTPQEFGLTTLTPAQYAEAARAAAIQEAGGVPVEAFSTPVTAAEGMKEGGLASATKRLESKGRNGDSMLVHMTPGEVAGLQQIAMKMGGSLSINPQTGLPEANFFKKILPFVAAVAAPYLAPGLLGAGIAGGLAGVGTMLGGGSFKEGITTGLTAFGAAGLSSGAMGSNPLGVGGESTFNQANTIGPASTGNISPEAGGVEGLNPLATGEISRVSPSVEQLSQVPATVTPQQVASSGTILGMKPSTALIGGMMASSLYTGEQERDMYQKQYDDYIADVEARKRRGMESFERSSMPTYAARGGLMSLAGGGITYAEGGGTTGPTNEPRMVQGTGDGMSDSVPATIEGVQEARLANDEFVIPADVVADLGNGSSNAGAKQLYAMMDRIRKARHGTTEQPPEINAMKLMPA